MGLSITWCLFPNRMNKDRTSKCKQALIVILVACAHNPVLFFFIDSGCKIKAQTSVNVQDNERDLDG